MEGATKYGCWLETWNDDDRDVGDDEVSTPTWRFKCVGELTDVQAAIARATLELDENETLEVRIEPFHADA